MKAPMALVLALAASSCLPGVVATGAGAGANPLGTVLQLMDELAAKIIKEGEAEAKAYHEFFEWCDDTSKNGEFAIKTASSEKAKLEAKINELTSDADVASAKIEELAAAVAASEAELKNATAIQEKEAAEFAASESELMDAVSTLERAVSVLEREMAKNPAALAQVDTSSAAQMAQALSAVLDAAAFPGSDQKKLLALVQSESQDGDEEGELGTPAAAAYKSHSGGLVDLLEDMKEKAEGQLADLRKAEVNTKHNFEMLAQSLKDQAEGDTKDMDEEKAGKASAEEAKAAAQGDLKVTEGELANSQKGLETAKASCLTTAADHEATVNARDGELKVIAEAKKTLKESTSGAASESYSLLQLSAAASTGSRLQTRADLARSEVITLVKRLAKKSHSTELAQLASRIAAVARLGAVAGEDPFGKVKGLIQDMIAKLEKESGSEATEKAYCDEQMAKTEEKKGELEYDISKLTSKIDQATAKSAGLKEQIQELQNELAVLTKEQAEMDKIRSETHADYAAAKSDLQQGLEGVRKALSVLREYYAADSSALLQAEPSAFMQQPAAPEKHGKAAGAGGSIIGILEVVESDFATNLAKEETEESDAQAEYEKNAQFNKITKTGKEQDVKYKTAESKSLDKTAAELKGDHETQSSELAAVLEYYSRIKDRCIAKPETYEQRAQRREAEIQGLKQALTTLEEETAFVQRPRRGGNFRGSLIAR